MKAIGFFALAALAGTPALAQDFALAYRGSGQRAGGPAFLLNDAGRPGLRLAMAEPRVAPVLRLRSGQMSGGPAREFIVWDKRSLSLQGTTYDPGRVVPFGYGRSGQRAGGPRPF